MGGDEFSQRIEAGASLFRDFVREIPPHWRDIFWLTIFILPFVYITSVAIFTLAEGLSLVTNNGSASSAEMVAFISLPFVSLIGLLILIVWLISSVVGYQIVKRLFLMSAKSSEEGK